MQSGIPRVRPPRRPFPDKCLQSSGQSQPALPRRRQTDQGRHPRSRSCSNPNPTAAPALHIAVCCFLGCAGPDGPMTGGRRGLPCVPSAAYRFCHASWLLSLSAVPACSIIRRVINRVSACRVSSGRLCQGGIRVAVLDRVPGNSSSCVVIILRGIGRPPNRGLRVQCCAST